MRYQNEEQNQNKVSQTKKSFVGVKKDSFFDVKKTPDGNDKHFANIFMSPRNVSGSRYQSVNIRQQDMQKYKYPKPQVNDVKVNNVSTAFLVQNNDFATRQVQQQRNKE